MGHATTRPDTPVNESATAGTLSTKATKSLDRMRARARKADDARTDACRHGADLADRTRHRWAR